MDDEPEIREILRDRFDAHGARVLEAENGHQAILIVEKTRVDAVVSDIRMAGGDGLTLLDKIRGRYPHLPVVCLVSGNCEITHEEVVVRGGLGLIQKPFKVADVIAAIADGLARATPSSSAN